jgi:hypothetical protein
MESQASLILACNSFLPIALGPRFYARTLPLVDLAFLFALNTHIAYWVILSTAHWSRPTPRPVSQPKIGPLLRIIFTPPVARRKAAQSASRAGGWKQVG